MIRDPLPSESSRRASVRQSLLLSLADGYLRLVLQLVSTAIIARLLGPAEIGVFAVAAALSAFASTFRDFGVAEYFIQERDLTDERIRAAFTINIATSWAMAALLLLGAPAMGDIYGSPALVGVMRIQSLSFLVVPFGAVTMAWFRRELHYGPTIIGNVLSSVSTFVASITLVYMGFSYYGLAWSSVVGVVVSVGAAIWFRPTFLPRWPGLVEVKHVFAYSKFANAVYVVGQAVKGAPEMIIGRVVDLAAVGVFSRANGLVEVFQRLVVGPIFQIAMPYFAHGGRNAGTVLPSYLASVSHLTAFGWTFLGLLIVEAYPAIRIMYGSQWMDAVPIAQVLCLACAIDLLSLLSREALLASGDARRANALQMGLAALHLVGLTAAIPYGLTGACWGMVMAAVLSVGLTQWHLHRGIGLRANALIARCIPSLALAVLSVGPVAVWSVLAPADQHNYWLTGPLGALLTASLWLVSVRVWRRELWNDLISWRATTRTIEPREVRFG